MSVFLSISETANLLGVTKQAIQKNCKADKYQTRQVSGRGGMRYEIALTSLPKDAQDRYHAQKLNAVAQAITQQVSIVKPVQTLLAVIDTADMTQEQRDINRHRACIVRFVQQSGLKVTQAIAFLNQGWADGSLDRAMLYALEHAFEKRNPKKLSAKTYYNWLAEGKERGTYAPKKRQKDYRVKEWHYLAIKLYCRPQQPTINSVAERLAEQYGKDAPSYSVVHEFFTEKMSQMDLLKGRHTGMALRAKQFHRIRTGVGLEPWDVFHADGMASHFTAPHPIHERYVTLEVWDAHDVATRYVPPLAIGLSENFEVIAKCMENAIRLEGCDGGGGVMAAWQTDSTKIVKNNVKFTGCPLLSIGDKAGITIYHPQTVGNAQANGIAENFHAWLDKECRELATYQAKGMDSLSFRRVQKLTTNIVKAKSQGDAQEVEALRKEIARVGKGLFFESYQQAVDWLEQKRQKWNNHPHSSLPKINDPVTGRKRHQTPKEALQSWLDSGWQPITMDESEIVDLFHPRAIATVRRGVVKAYAKMRYRHCALDHYEGKKVVVSYDINDYNQVWVMDLKGSLICVAPYCEDTPYVAQTFLEAAQEGRTVARINRLEKKIDAEKQQLKLTVIDGVVLSPSKKLTDLVVVPDEPEQKRSLADMMQALSEQSEELSEQPVKRSFTETVLEIWGEMEDDDDDEQLTKEETQ